MWTAYFTLGLSPSVATYHLLALSQKHHLSPRSSTNAARQPGGYRDTPSDIRRLGTALAGPV
jgi:hypothetical protein